MQEDVKAPSPTRKIVALVVGVLCGLIAASIAHVVIPAVSETQFTIRGAVKIVAFLAVSGFVTSRINSTRRSGNG